MARLHEYQGKELLRKHKVAVPKGSVASTPEDAQRIAEEIGGEVMVKAQAWVTGRAGMGGIKRAATPAEAKAAAQQMLGMSVTGFAVEQVLVEERLDIEREFYAGVIIDDRARAPVVIFSSVGGTGIEDIAREHPDKVARVEVDVVEGLQDYQARDLVRKTGVHGKLQRDLGGLVKSLYDVARTYEARAAEINPLVVTTDGRLYAADCRITVDDYAVFRHPDLGIEIAREFDRPPTTLEKIAYGVEEKDYRGTFYFIQMADDFEKGQGYIGFHGAGGGGSMMSMDALLSRAYKLATYVDTSGNPPASKVYRAARIVLSLPGIDGYFASGSGVASQEQFHSARGFVKAFLEERLSVPAVIRLGGNMEEKAIEILERAAPEIPAPLEAYGKDDTPDFCAERLDRLIKEGAIKNVPPPTPRTEPKETYTFESPTGTVTYDHATCDTCESKICVQTCVRKILKLDNGRPVLNISFEDAKKGRCIECLACEVECHFEGKGGGFVNLPIPGLEEYREGLLKR
ncbi:MAG: succinyl-CoA synthetase subunit beta [Anaerolineae bacterium]|nr:succinyl-CoA synthetase subunit beta [Anaerolineae bacterium]NIN93682.1 succinyl-CoA synthetase subunit beta [Anaerolineae bacterium]NIQ76729.1 succinyl-CoA synthetase subunit beta [Anaerolineae bacterium]